ncbi:hypothetical protein [Propionivibrio dicarboxylicus]|uniref:TubC N-terminal docking domain-containing protein n=1 Tax=Propionivibrio dicarboxylicus TaxID=83767 RepID=A0A1G7WJU8_9RHOO|nr:hypothetical protein [Propionivibrio dicarboxylicus]SDG72222.1 hypothetical protein SAMN05660652_00544 [Propionivibrio dicarboxylicus]
MTPATIIREAQADGVRLTLSPTGTIKATGDGAAVNRWLAAIRESKTDIIEALQAANDSDCGGLPPLNDSDEKRILTWLASVGETDTVTIGEVIDKCRCDFDARNYFIGRVAAELTKPEPFSDDRHRCAECRNLRGGICSVSRPGGPVSAIKGYRPVANVLQRCEAFNDNYYSTRVYDGQGFARP